MKKTGKFISYSMGNFANTIAYQVFANRIQFYYVDILQLNAAIAGVIWTIYGIWNAVNDPLMGQISDRTRTKRGRRVPYVLFGAIPLGLSFFFLWTPPQQPAWLLAIYFLMILFVFDTLYSLTIIAYNSLFPELATNIRERVNLSVIREIFATIALLISFILAPILADMVGYIWMGAIMGIVITLGYIISMIGVKERPIDDSEVKVGLGESLKIVINNYPFRWYMGAQIAKEYIWLVLAAMLPFWRKYALDIQSPIDVFGVELGPGDAEAILLGLAIVLTIPFIFLWRPIIIKIGYRKGWMAASFALIPGLFVMMIANNFYTGLVGTLLISPGLAGSLIMAFPVLSEIIDFDAQREFGYRREGIFFGMAGGLQRLAFSAQGILFASIMSATGYVAGANVQTTSAVWGIRILISGTSIVAALITVFCMWRYPLGKQTGSHTDR